jgi:carboxypeptidase family protein
MRSRARRLFVVLGVVVVTLAAATAHAQYRASLQGTVTDTQDAVIPGATVTLVDAETNRTLTAITDANGVYAFNGLAPHSYTIEVELSGFKKAVLQDVQIRGEQANTVDVKLDVGGASETVNVTGAAPLIDTATASVGSSVTTQQIQTMPSAGRDVLQLLQLAPGAFGTGARSTGGTENLPGTTIGGSSASAGIFATENGGQIVANGARTGENNYQIDGVGVTSVSWGGTTVITPNEDAIKEVKIITNNYDAENGRYRGAQVQIISQNGTNNLHGSAFFKVNRPGLNAFQNYNGYGRAVQKDTAFYNDIGGTAGGPILKNRLFGFFSYETIRNDAASVVQGWYQTPEYMSLTARPGSAAARFLTFPGSAPAAGTVLMGAGDSHRCADIGLVENVNCRFIEGQGLDVGRPLDGSFALGTRDPSHVDRFTPGLGGDGSNSPSNLDGVPDLQWRANINPTKSKAEQYNVRVDFNITPNDLIAFSMFRVPQSSDSFNGSVREMNAFHHTQLNEAETVIWNHVFSPSLLNEARANVAGWNWKDLENNPEGPWGLPSVYIQRVDGGSTLGTLGDNHLDFGIGAPGLFDQKTIGVKNTLTKVLNSHTIKMGGEITRMTFVDTAPWSARPSYYFNNMWDFLNDAPTAENATFDPRTGVPTDFRKDTRQTLLAFFVQDSYKVRANLTLTLGLRWERFGSISEKNDNLSSVVLGPGNDALTGMSLRLGGTLYEVNKTDFGPQIGSTWSPARFDDRLVLRGGFGIGYNGLDQAISLNGRSNAPFLSAAGNLTGSQIVYGVNSFPPDVHSFSGYASNPATIASFDPNTNLPAPGPNFALIAVTGFPAEWPTTYSYRYSADLSYDLGRQWVATVGYQGSTTRHLTRQYNLNLVYAAQGIPLNPVVNGVDWYANDGKARFNALLGEIRHRFSNAFELSAQYRLSESLDDGSNNFATDHYQYDPSASYGPSDYDVTHAFKMFGVWSPQIFKDADSWAEKLLGGWTISGILNAHSGFPWTPVYNNIGCGVVYAESGANGGGWNCALRPAAYLGGAGDDYSVDAFRRPGGNFPNGGTAYFTEPERTTGPPFADVAAGLVPAGPIPQAPGVGRNSFRGPRYFNVDATLNKTFGIPAVRGLGPSPKLDIRAGFYNLFNKINLKNIQADVLNEHFGEAQEGLGGRTVELQARFSF